MSEIVVTYNPRGGAKKLLQCRDSEVLICGPAGTGKSLAMLEKLHLTCLLVPGLRALLVRQTHSSLTGTTLVTFEKTVVPEAMAVGIVTWFGGSARQPAAYRYSNGSTILVGGLDRPEKFLSSEFDRIAIDEATEITESALETLITRLRGTASTYKQIICACNPAQPSHWIKARADSDKMALIHSRHTDNPAYYRLDGELTDNGASYMEKLDALTGVRRLRLKDGMWASAEGVIYDEFDPLVHVVNRFDIPMAWPRYWSVDFGYTNPFVLQCWAEDPDGRLYLYREIYQTKTLVEDHVRTILRTVTDEAGRWLEPRPQHIICDHDAEDRATLERHLGLRTIPAKKTVSDGLQVTQVRFRDPGDGQPRIFFLQDSVVSRDAALADAKRPCSTIEEITGYVWDTSGGKKVKESPLKEDDHGMDAMRYLVVERDLGRRPRYTSFSY